MRENKWRAARHGLDAEIIYGEHNDTRPLREDLAELVHELQPTAERLGCFEQLSLVNDILVDGASYQRQRAVAAASGGDLTAVVDSLLQEFETGERSCLPTLEAVTGEAGAPGATP
jgi:glutamate---cysteine ligase / carboxylate-amine ligase